MQINNQARTGNEEMKESAVDSYIIIDAAQSGDYLWRNNTGAFQDKSGRWIRYGLMNESEKINKICKSSDRIGITSVIVTPEMVGQKIGIFTAIETKHENWKFIPGDERYEAQLNFLNLVLAAGGRAGFARSVYEYRQIVRK